MLNGLKKNEKIDFEDQGFVIFKNFFKEDELSLLLNAVKRIQNEMRLNDNYDENNFQIRNLISHDESFLDLIDNPKILSLVVDALGWNIQIRTSHLDVRKPYPEELREHNLKIGKGKDLKAGYRNVFWHADLSEQRNILGCSLDGILPFMEIKLFIPLFDMNESNCGNLWFAPGTHKRPIKELIDNNREVPKSDSLELKLNSGDMVLWRTALWHCVGPNYSNKTRKIIHIGYQHRWLRPTDYIEQSEELISESEPIRQQLLGALPKSNKPGLGSDSKYAPVSQYWFPENDEDVPLKNWAENNLIKTNLM